MGQQPFDIPAGTQRGSLWQWNGQALQPIAAPAAGQFLKGSNGIWAPASITGADIVISGAAEGDLFMYSSGAWIRLAAVTTAVSGQREILGLRIGDADPNYQTAFGTGNSTTAAPSGAASDGIHETMARDDHGHAYPATWPATFDATNPSTITEGAAAVVGSASAASHRDHSHPTAATWTPTAHGASAHTDRTRRIPLHFSKAMTEAVDSHGSINGSGFTNAFPHVDCADGADTNVVFEAVIVPSDAVGTWTINILYSSGAAGNNVAFKHLIETLVNAATSESVVLNTSATDAAPAVANTIKLYSVAFGSSPGANAIMEPIIQRNGTALGDTNTGPVAVWGGYLEYTADS